MRPRRGVDFGYRELIELDMPALVAAVRSAYPGVPLFTGGHSLGVLGLDSSPLNARAVSAYHIVEISLSSDELVGRATSPGGDVIDEFRVIQ